MKKRTTRLPSDAIPTPEGGVSAFRDDMRDTAASSLSAIPQYEPDLTVPTATKSLAANENMGFAMTATMLPTINAVWIGKRIGPVHSACLASFVRVGHRTVLHAFDEIEDVPQGVEIVDASKLMNIDELVCYRRAPKSGLALASDIYRLRILRENLGIYVDCDVYCLKPFPDVEYLFGWEYDTSINNAVMRMPAASELLRCMLNDAENPKLVPPWSGRKNKLQLRIRKILGTVDTRPYMRWGSLGPHLLTHHVKRLGLQDRAMAIDAFYPVHYDQTTLLTQPGLTLQDNITSRSIALHLWCSITTIDEIQPGSTLDQIVRTTSAEACVDKFDGSELAATENPG